MKLNLHIDRLVLDGTGWGASAVAEFEAGLRTALEREVRAHRSGSFVPATGAVGMQDRMQVVLTEPAGAGEMGEALGRAIHGRIRR